MTWFMTSLDFPKVVVPDAYVHPVYLPPTHLPSVVVGTEAKQKRRVAMCRNYKQTRIDLTYLFIMLNRAVCDFGTIEILLDENIVLTYILSRDGLIELLPLHNTICLA